MTVKSLLLYGVSVALNRAGMLLLVPLSAIYVKPVFLGDLNIYLVTSSLLSVILTMNISVIIAREYYEDKCGVMHFVNMHNFIMLFMIFALFLVSPFFYSNTLYWVVGFVLSECLFIVNSNLIRFQKGPYEYFKLTLLKFLFLLISFYFSVKQLGLRDNDLVLTIVIIIFVCNLGCSFLTRDVVCLLKKPREVISLKRESFNSSYLIFAISLIPHSIAQWFNSSFDRLFVKWFFGSEKLGLYSFSYSVASLLLLVSSSYALGLPQLCVTNLKLVGSSKFYRIFFVINSVFLWGFIYLAKIVLPYFSNYDNKDIFSFVVILSCGLYFLFFYLYFSSSLFYERKGSLISKITFFVCLYSVFSLYPLSSYFGLLGVCMVTLSAYVIYMLLVSYYSFFASYRRVLSPIVFSFFTVVFFLGGVNV
ncbi:MULTISPECIES: lipopolysaccharide biosynthesis protein [unclassified Salinivibrio]|uniref:lipopolysaccharide biosynthesis protein n=1 Tax=unclassified Salinivibrio TaxID=2636825 RepID=UPI00128DB28C|nr:MULTISPECIES: hypothetical protein [unclassified Salinivibrio]MPS31255.1 hypothetical protein [Salinivibrio sp. VYel7]MPX92655.1 hypothetical protein [Salinivibrio sp. VYel9]MPX95661.1 hypothetical protein [Salinivibrio sp. VYel6]MPY01294.1 hypothetical protein [Salinivibrio sp. VYel4]MPY02421.1 hypothetical protein [Salinivibrio sp. VYel5]